MNMKEQSDIDNQPSVDEYHHQIQQKSSLRMSTKRSLSVVRLSTKQPAYRSESAMKALKMSIIHVVTFIAFWTPYSVMATWLDLDIIR